MVVSVGHTYTGNVAVVEVGTLRRQDLTPQQAIAAADLLDPYADRPGAHEVFLDGIDGRFSIFGTGPELKVLAAELRLAAEVAQSTVSTRH